MDRSPKLQNIFSHFINNYVTDSNLKDVHQFFKHNMPPPMAQPRKKFRQAASKSRQIVDGSSSSSSTASPPLVNSTKSKILPSSGCMLANFACASSTNNILNVSVSRLNAATSPAKSVTSTSSVRSSSSSIASIPTNAEEMTENSLGDRNDPYLKVYYWLKDQGLTEMYTHLKRYRFDEFCKLQPCDIDVMSNLATQQKLNLKEALSKMHVEGIAGIVDINMGALSISSKASSSDTSSDGGKLLDIKSILDDVARQSEDERSGSSQSAAACFTNFSNPDAAISDTGLSFEFEGGESEEKTSPSSQTDEFRHDPSDIPCVERNAANRGVHPVNDVSSTQRYLHPTVPKQSIRYCSAPYENSQNWYPYAYSHHYLPLSSYKVVPNVPTQPSMGNVSAKTIPSPIYLQPSNSSQCVYTGTAAECQHNREHDSVLVPHLQARPSLHSEVAQPRQNRNMGNRSSTISNDTDSALKHHSEHITTESVIPNLPTTAYPSQSYYALAPRYSSHHHPTTIVRTAHPLAPSYSDSTIHPSQTQRHFKRSEHNQPNLTTSVSAHAMNGYPENRHASHRMCRESNRGRHKRHNYGDGPRKGHILHCCNCGKKGHNSTMCRDVGAANVAKSDYQLETASSRRLRTNK